MLDARVIGKDGVPARPITKKTNDRRVRPVENARDAPFGALTRRSWTNPSEFNLDVIAVHGVAYCVAWDKDIPVKLRQWVVRNHETVAVLMEDEAA